MRKLLAALFILSLVASAHAQKSKTDMTTEINTNLPDNTTGAITPAILRTTIIDVVNSYLDLNGTSAFNCGVNQWISAFASLSQPACTQPNFNSLAGGIATSQIAGGVGATGNTYLRGDLTWATPPGSGTVSNQTNTAGNGLTTSGNCANTGDNSGSPCQYDVALSTLTNSLSGNVALNNNSNFFDGPTVAQGNSGTWFASGTVTINNLSSSMQTTCKLWDGTTVIASTQVQVPAIGTPMPIALSGIITSPAGNIRISCRANSTAGLILQNTPATISTTANASTITALRIQ